MDVRRYTAIPGLIDVHTHMTYWRNKANSTAAGLRSKDSVFMAAACNAHRTLETGVTTSRDLGASNDTDIAMRDAIDSGAQLQQADRQSLVGRVLPKQAIGGLFS